ncbi:cyanophycinase (plasmid) [Gemmatirosa kalamazoonensis]|uniref:Cyanophycinase n=1 Tax=Gemmatirosa kalamazoonensis TaxID=861299 RepID=W0RRJ6_9BACT|nr:cyanophycinase [Gemmatirosa kalamazoonensis]AHG93614.1 cyanophycinase [Gemmatirosa kalamazoonensis]
MRLARLRPALALLLATAGAAGAQSPRGTLFIVGGGTQPKALVDHFVALAGGPGKARIAILPMASGDPSTGPEKELQLDSLGADAFVVNVTRDQADADSIVRLVANATGIWFPGGDQARLARALAGSKLLHAIHARYQAGAVVGGTSAGAAIMSDSMLTGNQFRADGTVDTSGTGWQRVARRSIEIVPGLGFLHGAVVDQHFLRRQRNNRLLSVVLERPTLLGVGIDEGTALRVDPDGRWTIEGASAAIVFDARDAAVTPAASPARLGASGIRLHVLPAGSTFDPRTGKATLPPATR